MKPDVARRVAEDGSVRVEYQVLFSPGPRRKRRVRDKSFEATPDIPAGPQPAPLPSPKITRPARIPKVTRLLALGHHFERLVRDGAVKDYAEIAKLAGLTRARVTQIVNLTLLAPEIQERILFLGSEEADRTPRFERDLRIVLARAAWEKQAKRFSSMRIGNCRNDVQARGVSRPNAL